MSKADERRVEIVERLADFLLAEGLGAASLRPLAGAAGLSDRMLLYYFRDKTEAVAAALDRVAARMADMLAAVATADQMPADALRVRALALVLAPDAQPYMRLWLELAAGAGRGDPFCRATGERLARGFLEWTAAQLAAQDDATRRQEATRLLAAVEGSVLLAAMGLGPEVAAAFAVD